ncbi:hypothetical protein DFQ14_104275 [Halopolyspora algeriensis]|uniref:Uncharacterized protein n=1 Tax=Halopolyspora algeriensis TaxID=1500506 RepID=A0A368VSP2_9ACTN|nr:hypothetical protein [Halopolyspora algeriensis]RCW44685.1 hypothetical protein DFQ14_104275 [Halopolyspora algeriensis]TQM56043.1 hypothetical protein FHU43_0825 [Halopolyspora algeriensis]
MTGRCVASDAQIAMQHRYRCPPGQLVRLDALPPWDERTDHYRFVCDSCGLYLTGTQLTE